MELDIKYDAIRKFWGSIDNVKDEVDKQESKSEPQVYIILIGIDNYFKEIDSEFCENDSELVLKTFSAHFKPKSKNIYRIYNQDATKINILTKIEKLSKSVKPIDKVFVYIAGHGFTKNNNSYFVPSDGKRDIEFSCIPNNYFFNVFKDYLCRSLLLIFDMSSLSIYQKKQDTGVEIEYIKKIYDENKKSNSLYSDFLNFLSLKRKNKTKESFLLQKSFKKSIKIDDKLDIYNPGNKESTLIVNNLKYLVKERYMTLKTLSSEKKNQEVLSQLKLFLENNDKDLYSRCLTLEYKLEDVNRNFLSNEIDKDKFQEEIREIDRLTVELVEKVNNNGFYLVRVPQSNSFKEIENRERVKILFASANPVNLSPLRLDKELREIEYELLKSRYRDKFELIKFQALRISDLQDAMLKHSPQFIHFSGHGNCDGIALVDDLDNTKLVKSKPLANLFHLFSNDIKCVFLNSCHSIEQSKEISKSVNKVVCMSNEVPDDVAIHFAKAFYKSIGAGKDISFSFKFAQNSIELYGLSGSEIPLLLPEKKNEQS